MIGGQYPIFGVGINDSGYVTRTAINTPNGQKTTWQCPFYAKWKAMMARCYSARAKLVHPAYGGLSCCPEWLRFSSFRAWMVEQDYEGNELDKDLLILGNKVYSPERCIFITPEINQFIVETRVKTRELPVGVHFDTRKGVYIAQVNDPFLLKRVFLGNFSDPLMAHDAWRRAKHSYALQYVDMQKDSRVAESLRTRYLKRRT